MALCHRAVAPTNPPAKLALHPHHSSQHPVQTVVLNPHHTKFCRLFSLPRSSIKQTPLTVPEKSIIDSPGGATKAADFFHHSPACTG
jgi:hypothetical protein